MSDKEKDLEIVVDDAPEIEKRDDDVEIVVSGEQEGGSKPEASGSGSDDGIEELRRRLEQERQARLEAEKRAYQAGEQAFRAAAEVEDTQYHLVRSAFDSVRRDQDILRSNLREAMQVGDYDKAAEINESMSMNSIKLSQLEQGLVEMQSRAKAAPEQRQQQPAPRPVSNQVDDLIQRVTPLSARWLQDNRDHLQDQRSLRIVARAHEDAIDMGIIPESSDYFALVESRLGIQKGAPQREESSYSSAAAPVQRRTAPPAAPVSRGGRTATRSGAHTLTPLQAEAAKISGLTNREYYDQMVKEKNRSH
jgi:hypothetical protein